MNVDLDRYREPSRTPEAQADRRAALLDQLGWLAEEADALAPLLDRLPTWAVDAAPLPGDRSVRATLAHLAHLDRTVHARWVERLEAEEHPALVTPEEDAGAARPESADDAPALDTLVAHVREARTALVAQIEALPPAVWEREGTLEGAPVTLHDLLLRVARHDVDLLRALAYRLHEAKLTDPPPPA